MRHESQAKLHFKHANAFAVAATLFAAWTCLSCGKQVDPQSYVREKIKSFEVRTTPPGSNSSSTFGSARERESFVSRWEFDTTWNAAKYSQWVTNNLVSDCKVVTASESRLVFGGYSDGDAIDLDIKLTGSMNTVHVSVTLVMYPD